MFEADRAVKTDLRRDLRAQWRPLSRVLSQAPQDNLQDAVLSDYCEGLREALRADGLSPFELAGLKLYDELQRDHPQPKLYVGKENLRQRLARSRREWDE